MVEMLPNRLDKQLYMLAGVFLKVSEDYSQDIGA